MSGTRGWQVFDEDLPILTYEYSFGPDHANALAVGIPGGIAVVSAPCRVDDSAFAELAKRGPVKALIASNAFHHMGLPEWQRRFPEAALFAPAQSIARVERRSKLGGIRPLADLAPLAGPGVEFLDMPHYKTGEVLVRMTTARGVAWYLTDVVLNFEKAPGGAIGGLLFRALNTAPGLKFNNVASTFMMRDKKAVKRWLAAEYDRAPPRFLIPAHGPIVACAADDHSARSLFATR